LPRKLAKMFAHLPTITRKANLRKEHSEVRVELIRCNSQMPFLKWNQSCIHVGVAFSDQFILKSKLFQITSRQSKKQNNENYVCKTKFFRLLDKYFIFGI